MEEEELDWRRRGLCSDFSVDPDMWFSSEARTRRLAQHLCLVHCPVLRECRKEMDKFTFRGVVIAGVIWSDHENVPVRDSVQPVSCYMCQKHPEWDWKPLSDPRNLFRIPAWR